MAFILFCWIGEIGPFYLSTKFYPYLRQKLLSDSTSQSFCPLFCVTVADKQGLCTTKRPAQCGYVSMAFEFLAAKKTLSLHSSNDFSTLWIKMIRMSLGNRSRKCKSCESSSITPAAPPPRRQVLLLCVCGELKTTPFRLFDSFGCQMQG